MDEKYLEQAAALTEAQRQRAQDAARAACAKPGQVECEDCGDEIPAQRRLACPSATRCLSCQIFAEAFSKRYAHKGT